MQKKSSNQFFKFLLLAFFIILPVFYFSSCKNFLDAQTVKQEIIEYIEYCNATECTLYISQDSSTGVFLSSAKQKCRVGYTTELQVTVNRSNYVFQTLDAVSINDLSVSRLDCLEFRTETIDEEKGIYKIIIKLLKEAHDILLCPVCSLIPKITGVTPAIETSGCEQDLEIKVTFNKEMDKESFGDFSCLKITSDGDDLTSLFATPFFTGNGQTLVITPLCASQSEDFSSSFLLEPSGTVNTRKITVEFNFTGDQKDKEGIPITGFSEYTYKVNKNLSQNELPSMHVEITGDSGDFTPTIGIKDCIKTYTYQLSFRPYDDYEFIRWEIFNKANGTAIQNGTYITIENPDDRNTTYSFAELPEDDSIQVAVRPVVVDRPRVLNHSPEYSPEGTNKDTMIQLMFDNDMDPYSIYYTKDEINTLYKYGVAYEDFLPAVNPSELDGNLAEHYGYKKGSGSNEEYIFKNISITNNENGESLNICFDKPVFEGRRILSVPFNREKIEKLPNYALLLVSFDRNISCMKDGISVCMTKSEKWTYQVTDATDDKKPVIAQDSNVKVYFPGENGANGSVITKGNCPAKPWQNIYNNAKKLSLDIRVLDNETGPSPAFVLRLERVQDNNYQTCSGTFDKGINYQNVKTKEAFYKNTVDFSDLNIPDGVYKASFVFRDKSSNELIYPSDGTGYYFTVDNAIGMDEPVITDTSNQDGVKLKLDWAPTPDFKETKIYCKKAGTQEWLYQEIITDINQKTREFVLPELATNYYFEIENTDLLGHKQALTVNKESASFERINVNGTTKRIFYCAGEPFEKEELTITAYLSNDECWETRDFSVDVGNQISMGKSLDVSYTFLGVTRTSKIPNKTYYIGAQDALTNVPVLLQNYNGTITGGTYYKFGDFPQTVLRMNSNITFTENTVYNGWYLGSDGYLYEKCIEDIGKFIPSDNNLSYYENNPGYQYSTGERIKYLCENSYRYFKIEPIVWRVLTNNYNGNILLMSEKILNSKIPIFYNEDEDNGYPGVSRFGPRTINGVPIYANNWKYSEMRAYLNGKYESDDPQQRKYENSGFLQKAFTNSAQSYIREVTVDNSVESTLPANYNTLETSVKSGKWNNGENPYVCDNTVDKIFLLSEKEVTTTGYGFDDYFYGSRYDISRMLVPSDYAKARRINYDTYHFFGEWWIRTPCYWDDIHSLAVDSGRGYSRDYRNTYLYTNQTEIPGIVPAMCIQLTQ